MERRVLVDTWQKVTRDDFLKFGTFPRDSFDTIVGKVLIPDLAYEGFSVVASGVAEVTVGNGHLLANGQVFFNDTEGGTVIDLLSRLPAATKRIVTIAVWGTEIDSSVFFSRSHAPPAGLIDESWPALMTFLQPGVASRLVSRRAVAKLLVYNEARTQLQLRKDAPIPCAVQTVGQTLRFRQVAESHAVTTSRARRSAAATGP